MPAPEQLHQLIERFERNLDAYRSGQYNETQVRRDFIDPLLKLLGWDVDNKKGYAEQYREVVHEDAVKVSGSTKAPDYSLRIGGQRKLFVEAKKPSVNIKQDIAPAFQVRRYAWSAKLPLSILTDFEEFAVYDCRDKPDKSDKASHARIMYLTFREYAEKWDELVALFSPEAIMQGAFDKYVQSSKKKRGTAEVDDAFLAEISVWRDALARNIALRNPGITTRQLNHAVQRTIDRLIFLRIAEDRGIEGYGRLRTTTQQANIYAELSRLFQLADAKYNSGLFHFKPEKGRDDASLDTFTLSLNIDDKVLRDLIKRFYYPDSPYQFDVIPADILGQVYEQFLGKVIRLTPKGQAKVEEKPEVKKAGGVFYTPTYIVNYIVEQTVGQLLEGKKPGPKADASKLRILDPACGSGSFLLGAYQFLLDWHRSQYLKTPDKWARGKNPAIYKNDRGEWRLTIGERKRILLNNIYGVDIDPQAVEVTKLSLLLKVMEGETEQTLGSQLRLLPERVLPDLSHNIQCGNSLIGPDFYDGQMSLGILDEEEMYRINVFDWEKAFPRIVLWGGFDAAIGNPPYGAYLGQNETDYLHQNFNFAQYQLDTYILFTEKSLSLLKKDGYLGYIIPNTWLLNLNSDAIRSYIFNQSKLEKIVHYGRAVFPKVTVDTEVVVIKNTKPTDDHQIAITVISKDAREETYKIYQQRWQSQGGAPVNLYERPEYTPLADKLRDYTILDQAAKITQGTKPFQTGKGKPKQTKEIVKAKPYVSETKRDETFRPLLRGSLMQRYRILWDHNYYISFGDWLAEPRYSANFEASSKIIIRQTGDSLVATLDTQQFIVRDNLYTIVPKENKSAEYFLGLINSRLLNWYYQTILNPEMGEALAQVKRGHLAKLPIAPSNVSEQQTMIMLVSQMLELHKRLAAAQTAHEKSILQRQITATDRQIDQLVYQLYNLTPEEIAIVENQT